MFMQYQSNKTMEYIGIHWISLEYIHRKRRKQLLLLKKNSAAQFVILFAIALLNARSCYGTLLFVFLRRIPLFRVWFYQYYYYYVVFVVRRTQRDIYLRPLLHWCRVRFCYFNCVTLFFNFLSHYFLFSIRRALASLSLERFFDALLISSKTSSSMDRYLSSPNFDVFRPRSNSLSPDPYYCFSASATCHRRDAVHISSRLPPLHPISTTHEVPCTSATVHAVPSPTIVCNSPQTNDDTQAAISQIAASLGSLGFDFQIRRRDAPQSAVQPVMYGSPSKLVPHYSGLCEVLAVRGPILTLRELDTRRQFSANHDAVRLSSLTPNRLPAAAPPLLDADDRAPSPPPDVIHRAPSPTPSSTPPHSPTASPAIGDDALLAPPTVAAPQHLATSGAQLDTHSRPQRRRNPPPYLDDYVVSPFQRAYNVKCAKILESHSKISDDLQPMRSSSSSRLLDVHSFTQSNHDDSLLPNTNANDNITIGFIYSSDDSVPSPVPSYSYCVPSSVENFVESQPFSRHWARTSLRTSRRRRRLQRNIERLKAACCERVKRRKSALFALTFVAHRKAWAPSTAPVTPCASSPTAATVRSSSVAPRSVSLKFHIPTNH